MPILHYVHVNTQNIVEDFTPDRLHRVSLHIPFLNRNARANLCVIGQNPSSANARYADRTVRFLEEYIYQNMPQYSSFTMLNLYTRVDTNKTIGIDIRSFASDRGMLDIIHANSDFIVVFGQLKTEGAYKFRSRAGAIKRTLIKHNKNVFKFDLQTDYAPHPRNRRVSRNTPLTAHNFLDIP